MAHISTNATWVDYPATTTLITAAKLENIENQLDIAGKPPLFLAQQAVAQTSISGITPITLTTEEIDTHNGHSTSTNTSRYTCQLAGYYECAGIIYTDGSTGARNATMLKNGVEVVGSPGQSVNGNGDNRSPMGPRTMLLALTDYVELTSWSTVVCNTISAGVEKCYFQVRYVGPV